MVRNVGQTDEGSCQLPLSQVVLADALGLTAVYTDRILRSLRERGIVTLGSGELTIVDIGALVKVAGFDETCLHRRIEGAG